MEIPAGLTIDLSSLRPSYLSLRGATVYGTLDLSHLSPVNGDRFARRYVALFPLELDFRDLRVSEGGRLTLGLTFSEQQRGLNIHADGFTSEPGSVIDLTGTRLPQTTTSDITRRHPCSVSLRSPSLSGVVDFRNTTVCVDVSASADDLDELRRVKIDPPESTWDISSNAEFQLMGTSVHDGPTDLLIVRPPRAMLR